MTNVANIKGQKRQAADKVVSMENLHMLPFEKEYTKLDIRYDASVDNLIGEIHFLKESINKIKTLYQLERGRLMKENQELTRRLEDYETKIIASREAIKVSSADYQQMVAKCQDENKRLHRELEEEKSRPSIDESTRKSMQSTILEVHDLRLSLQHLEERYKSERSAWLTRNQDLTCELEEATKRSREDNKALAEAAVFYQTSLGQFRKENFILKEELMTIKVIKAANEEEMKRCQEEVERLNEELAQKENPLDEQVNEDEMEHEEEEPEDEDQQTVAPRENQGEDEVKNADVEELNEQNTTADAENLQTDDIDLNVTHDQLSQQLNEMENNMVRSSLFTDDQSPPDNPVDKSESDKSGSWVEIADIKEERKDRLSKSERVRSSQDEVCSKKEVERLRNDLLIQQKLLLSLQGSMLRNLDKEDPTSGHVPRRESDLKFRMLTTKIKRNEKNFINFQRELEEIIELAKLEDNAVRIHEKTTKKTQS